MHSMQRRSEGPRQGPLKLQGEEYPTSTVRVPYRLIATGPWLRPDIPAYTPRPTRAVSPPTEHSGVLINTRVRIALDWGGRAW